MKLCIDFETRSKADLKKRGAHAYAADPSTEVMCLAIKEDDKPSRILVPPEWMAKLAQARSTTLAPHIVSAAEVLERISAAEIISAHNISFEQTVWHHVCHKRMGWPDLPADKLRCSAARAAACSLPRALGAVCAVLGLPQQKDADGHLVMMRMCRPRRARKQDCDECHGTGLDFIDNYCTACDGTGKQAGEESWNESASDYEKLCLYCMKDTEAEYALEQALPELPPEELRLFQLDMRINNHGVRIDRKATEAWIGEIEKAEKALLAEWFTLTNKQVKSPKQVQKSLDYFKSEFNMVLDDFRKDTVADALETINQEPVP